MTDNYETRQFWETPPTQKPIDKTDIILWLKKRIKAIKLEKPKPRNES